MRSVFSIKAIDKTNQANTFLHFCRLFFTKTARLRLLYFVKHSTILKLKNYLRRKIR